MAKANRRPCPAVNRLISARECGENRASRYPCPATCPFLPWAPVNWEQAAEIEDRVTDKLFAGLAREVTPARVAEERRENTRLGAFAGFARWVRRLHRERDELGRTFTDRLLADRRAELTNEERVLLRRMTAMTPVLLEVHTVRDGQSFTAVDLLDPARRELLVVSPLTTPSMLRFSLLFMYGWELPHYTRIAGAANEFPRVDGELEPEEILEEVARHLGAPAGGEVWREWLPDHVERVGHALDQVTLARQERTVALSDTVMTTPGEALEGGSRGRTAAAAGGSRNARLPESPRRGGRCD